MKIIGLTGGIGSGKSTVAGFLAELGALVINADQIGHEVLKTDSQARQLIVAAFGQQVLAPDGSIDRSKLGKIVFGNHDALARLNRIMHPRIYRVVSSLLEQYRKQGTRVAVIEAPLLIEASWATKVDQLWVTAAAEATVLKRLGKIGLSRDKAMARIRSQLADSERLKLADIIINTDCSLDELRLEVGRLWQGLPFDTRER
jgi:dephospho-CoA kinase